MKSHRVHATESARPWRARWISVSAGIAVIAIAAVGSEGAPQGAQYPKYPPAIVRVPDVNKQNDINEQQQKRLDFEAANAARKKQINAESAKLLKLATELKAEVDKTDKETLSVGVIRKADEIEKLARNVKEKMQLAVGAS
jgi:hypothetical protein